MQIQYQQNVMALAPKGAQALAFQSSLLEHSCTNHSVHLDFNNMCEGLPTRQAHFRLSTQFLSRTDHLGTVLVSFPTAVVQKQLKEGLLLAHSWKLLFLVVGK